MTNGLGFVVFDMDVPVLFPMQVYFLFIFFIFKPDFVEILRTPLPGTAALDTALGGFGRQVIWGHVVVVVHPPGYDGMVRIASQELDDHFLPDARNVNAAPLFAGPDVGHPNPAGTGFV